MKGLRLGERIGHRLLIPFTLQRLEQIEKVILHLLFFLGVGVHPAAELSAPLVLEQALLLEDAL